MVESGVTQVSPISAPGPRDVVASFLRLTVDKPDFERARLHLSKRSAQAGGFSAGTVPAGSTYTLGAEEADELGRRIPVSMKSPSTDGAAQEMTLPIVVVEEDGEWKVDLPATMDRMFGGAMDMMGKAVGAMGEVLSTAMTGVGEALSQGMEAVESAPPVKKAAAKQKAIVKAVKKAAKKIVKKVKAKLPVTKKAKPAKKIAKKKAKKSAKAAKKSAKAKKPTKKKRR
jgi:hypothetical protein